MSKIRSIINRKELNRVLNLACAEREVSRAKLPTLKQCQDAVEKAALDGLTEFISPFNPDAPGRKKRVSKKQRENPELPLPE